MLLDKNREALKGFPHDSSGRLTVYSTQDPFFRIKKPEKFHWSIAWSDLMMTMFILFLVLFIYHSAKREFTFGEGESLTLRPEIKKNHLFQKVMK